MQILVIKIPDLHPFPLECIDPLQPAFYKESGIYKEVNNFATNGSWRLKIFRNDG